MSRLNTTTEKRSSATKKIKRKAPTKVATTKTTNFNYKLVGALVMAIVIVVVVSAYIGHTDKGEIDVKRLLTERAAMEEAKGNLETSRKLRSSAIQAEDAPTSVARQLKGFGDKETRQQEIERAKAETKRNQTKATSTDDTATSTEEIVANAPNASSSESVATSTNQVAEDVAADVTEATSTSD